MFGFGVLCFALAISLLVHSRRKFKSHKLSLGQTILGLLTMQHAAGFSLIIVAVLAFTWLIDYIREIPPVAQSTAFLSAGAFFSLGLLFIVAVIVVFFEKQKIDEYVKSVHGIPHPTQGLILCLSKWRYMEIIRINTDNIIRRSTEIRSLLFAAETRIGDASDRFDYERPAIIDHADALVQLIAGSPLYPLFLAIEHHHEALKHIWLLTSVEAESTTQITFTKIAKAFYPMVKIKRVRIDDPDSVAHISQLVDQIYLSAAINQHYQDYDITSDITSGPASATAGIILACVRSKRRVQYLSRRSHKLQSIDVTVRSIPHLFEEMMEQIEIIESAKESHDK